ncbi:MAG: TonB-dependent siderophore receptor, partial [Cyanobacteria bacterium P01_E01_bin.6]
MSISWCQVSCWSVAVLVAVLQGTAVQASPNDNEAVAAYNLTNNRLEDGLSESGDQDVFQRPYPATTVDDWIAQIETSLIQITGVQIEATEAGVQVILESSSNNLTSSSPRIVGNAVITEIPNAILALPEESSFEQFDVADGIVLVSVTALPNNQVQVSITGRDAPPEVQIQSEPGGLALGITPGVATADAGDSDAIQVVVTGEQDAYYVPNAATATRTDTPLNETPQSIQVIPQQVLEDQQVFRLNDALRNASGVVSSSLDQRGPRFIIRGFSSSAVLRDGFRLLNAGSGNVGFQELSNIERIEVLKGPASILSGALEPGGAINLVTELPLSEPFYEFGFRAGNRELIEPSIDFSGPLTSNGSVRYRLNALYRNEDFYRDFDIPIERYFISPVITFDISEQTELIVELEYSREERPSDFAGLPVIGDRVADIPFDRITGEPDDDAANEFLRVGYRFEHRFNDNWKVRNAFRYTNFDNEFVSNTAFQFIDEAAGDLLRIWVRNEQPIDNYELQTNVVGEFSTGSIEHTLLAGIDLFRQDFEGFREIDFTPQPLFNIFDPVYGVPRPDSFDEPIPKVSTSQTDNLGIYVQDQITLLDNVFFLVGARYDTVSQESENLETGTSDSQSDDAFTPRVGLVYQPIDNLSLYTSFSTSFNPNSAETISGDILEPERGRQFEVGARAELANGRLSTNLAFFNIV